MPIYEYACKECGHTLDALQKLSDAPLVDCPECGAAALRRLISAPRFRLKGDGWYETDFKKENQRNLLKSDSESPKDKGEGQGKADAADKPSPAQKGEDKPAPKADPKPASASAADET